jgi:hypothetical protein
MKLNRPDLSSSSNSSKFSNSQAPQSSEKKRENIANLSLNRNEDNQKFLSDQLLKERKAFQVIDEDYENISSSSGKENV